MQSKIKEYRDLIILGGYVVGILYILGFFPEKIGQLGDNSIFVYIGLMILAGYVYYKQFMEQTKQPQHTTAIQRYAPQEKRYNHSSLAQPISPQYSQPVHSQSPRPRGRPPKKARMEQDFDNAESYRNHPSPPIKKIGSGDREHWDEQDIAQYDNNKNNNHKVNSSKIEIDKKAIMAEIQARVEKGV